MPHAALLYLVNAAWQVPLVAVGAAVLARAGDLAAGGRHRVWLAALAVAAVLPALPGAGLVQAARPFARPVAVDSAAASSVTAKTDPSPAAAPAFTLPRLELTGETADLATLALFAVIAIGLARLVLAAGAAASLARRSDAFTLAPGVLDTLRRAAARRGRRPPEVRTCAHIAAPAVVGAIRPLILVPGGFADLPPDEQRAALLHELAHIFRRDFAVNLIAELVSLPVAWHPAAQLIKARIRASRELACDAMASADVGSRRTYARRLVSLVRRLAPTETPGAIVVGLIGEKSHLEERLMHLLEPARGGPRNRLRLLAAAVAAGVVLAPAVLLRVTPAFAAIPRPAPASPPAAPVAAIAPFVVDPPDVSEQRSRPVARRAPVHGLELARADEARGAQALATPPTPPEPPADAATRPLVDEAQIRRIVQEAIERSAEARKVMQSAEVQRAMAELRAHRGEWTAQARADVRGEIRQETQAALAEVRRELDSEDFRRTIREAAKAAAEAATAPPTPTPNPP